MHFGGKRMAKKAAEKGGEGVNRGGGWSNPPKLLSLSLAESVTVDVLWCCDNALGFRLVRRRSALERLADGLREVGDEQEEG